MRVFIIFIVFIANYGSAQSLTQRNYFNHKSGSIEVLEIIEGTFIRVHIQQSATPPVRNCSFDSEMTFTFKGKHDIGDGYDLVEVVDVYEVDESGDNQGSTVFISNDTITFNPSEELFYSLIGKDCSDIFALYNTYRK